MNSSISEASEVIAKEETSEIFLMQFERFSYPPRTQLLLNGNFRVSSESYNENWIKF